MHSYMPSNLARSALLCLYSLPSGGASADFLLHLSVSPRPPDNGGIKVMRLTRMAGWLCIACSFGEKRKVNRRVRIECAIKPSTHKWVISGTNWGKIRSTSVSLSVLIWCFYSYILDNVHCVTKKRVSQTFLRGKATRSFSKRTVRQRVDLDILGGIARDALEAGEGVLAVDVHGAGAANAFAARPPQGQSRVDLVLNLDEGVQHHRTAGAKIDLVFLHVRLLARLVRVPAVDGEGLHVGGFGLFGVRSVLARNGRTVADYIQNLVHHLVELRRQLWQKQRKCEPSVDPQRSAFDPNHPNAPCTQQSVPLLCDPGRDQKETHLAGNTETSECWNG